MTSRLKLGLFSLVIVLVGGVWYYLNQSHAIYGNDEESIVKVIHTIDGYENRQIEILDIKDLNATRIAAFLADSHPGFIEFQQNKQGNYEWKHIERHDRENFVMMLPNVMDVKNSPVLFVANSDNRIAKMQVRVNGTLVEQEIPAHHKTAVWRYLPETSEGQYTFREYKYFDENGDLISESE